MQGATQTAIKKQADVVGSKFGSETGVLAPTGMGQQLLPAEHISEEAEGGIDDVAVGSQPQAVLTGPA